MRVRSSTNPSTLTTYSFDSQPVRVVMRGDQPWFVASDVAKALGYRDSPTMTRNLDDDEKGTHKLCTLGGNQDNTVISESGLYTAILRSQKFEAKHFKRWVTSEVLPSIRRTGGYQMATGAALGPVSGDTNASVEETIDQIARMLPDYRDWKAVMWQQVCATARVATRDELRPEHMAKVSAELTRLRAVAAYHRRAFRSVQETCATTCARVEHEMRHGFDTSDAGVRKSGVSAG